MTSAHGQLSELGVGFVDRRRSPASGAVSPASKLAAPINYSDRNSLESYLLTQGYTQANLNLRSINDLVYAVRLKQDSAGI